MIRVTFSHSAESGIGTVSGCLCGLMRRMISSVELFVGLRYLRAKRRTSFVSFITQISVLGIAVGVAALIVILSVMRSMEYTVGASGLKWKSWSSKMTEPAGRIGNSS